jgi:hypothetical protein
MRRDSGSHHHPEQRVGTPRAPPTRCPSEYPPDRGTSGDAPHRQTNAVGAGRACRGAALARERRGDGQLHEQEAQVHGHVQRGQGPPRPAELCVDQHAAEGRDVAHQHRMPNPRIGEGGNMPPRKTGHFVPVVGSIGPQRPGRNRVEQEPGGNHHQGGQTGRRGQIGNAQSDEGDGLHRDRVALEVAQRNRAATIGQPIEIVVPEAQRVDSKAEGPAGNRPQDRQRDE